MTSAEHDHRHRHRCADTGAGNRPASPTEERPMSTTYDPISKEYPNADPILRSAQMSLMHEALARAQYRERLAEAEHERLAVRVVAARRRHRRAARAAERARRLAGLAAARSL